MTWRLREASLDPTAARHSRRTSRPAARRCRRPEGRANACVPPLLGLGSPPSNPDGAVISGERSVLATLAFPSDCPGLAIESIRRSSYLSLHGSAAPP